MMASRVSGSALLKSKVDRLDHRLRELEALATEMRRGLEELKAWREPEVRETIPAPLTPPQRPLLKKQIVKAPPPPKVKVIKRRGGNGRKFTEEVLAQIPLWIEQGIGRQEMADRIGTTLGCLQVTCSRLGISLWPKTRPRIQQVVFIHEQNEEEQAA